MKKLIAFMKNEDGQGMVEYGLILGLIAIAVVGALVLLGPKIAGLFDKANDSLTTSSAAASSTL